METNWVSSAGDFVDRFGAKVAGRVDREHGVPTASGTAALHLALRALGIGPGDEVLVNTLTFVAPANAVRYLDAHPVFVDAEPEYYQMDPDALRAFLEDDCERRDGDLVNAETGRPVRAVLPVHVLGHPCRIDEIADLAREHGLAVVEDACESLGAEFRGEPVGSHGDVAAFSFNGNKIVTAGGGGVLATDDEALAERARHLSTQAKADPVGYVHDEIGYNYRLTNLQAAVGCAQMNQLDDHVEAKRAVGDRYAKALDPVDGIEPMPEAPWARSTRWMYTIRVDPDAYGETRAQLQARLREQGIQVRPLWQPMHESPAHEALGGPWPTAGRLREECLSLPCSVGLDEDDQARVLAALRREDTSTDESDPPGGSL